MVTFANIINLCYFCNLTFITKYLNLNLVKVRKKCIMFYIKVVTSLYHRTTVFVLSTIFLKFMMKFYHVLSIFLRFQICFLMILEVGSTLNNETYEDFCKK